MGFWKGTTCYHHSNKSTFPNGYRFIISKKEAIKFLLACTEGVIHIYMSVAQIQNNWSYGETLDENAKTHPMLRPYKTFSEKVGRRSHDALNLPVLSPQPFWCLNTDCSSHRTKRSIDGRSKSQLRPCSRGSGTLTKPEKKRSRTRRRQRREKSRRLLRYKPVAMHLH